MMLTKFTSVLNLFLLSMIFSLSTVPSAAQETPSRITDILNLKDKALDRICETVSNVLKNLFTNCGKESYCDKLKNLVEGIPVACGVLNESFNESVRKLVYCVRHHDSKCVDLILEDMNNKLDQAKEMGDVVNKQFGTPS